jgi:hypothetical protein
MASGEVMELIFFFIVALGFAGLGLAYFLCKSQDTRESIKDMLRAIQIGPF